MSDKATHPHEGDPSQEIVRTNEVLPAERPWWAQPVVKVLLWSIAAMFVVFVLMMLATVFAALSSPGWSAQDFDALTRMDALQAAGVFGRGANGQLIAGLRAVVAAMKDNLLGFVGATIVLAIIGLAISLGAGDPRAQERVSKLVQGVLMLAAATGFVA